jgi:hypothetical protein
VIDHNEIGIRHTNGAQIRCHDRTIRRMPPTAASRPRSDPDDSYFAKSGRMFDGGLPQSRR